MLEERGCIMGNQIITISREYYAGGRSVAKKLSEQLGIEWYDYDLAKMASKASGYSEEEVLSEGEEISWLENTIEKMLTGASFYTSSHDEINQAFREVLLELAKKPCIIVGRGANAVLSEAKIKSFDVFLYADISTRIKRTMEMRGMQEDAAKHFLEKHDALRSLYYNKYFGRTYGDAREYTMSLDTGSIDYDLCTEIIVKAVDKMDF